MIKVKYNHPSVPQLSIDINKVYIINQDKDKYFININKKDIEISLFDLKTLFEVIEGSLDENKETKVKKKNENYKKEVESTENRNIEESM